MNNEQQETEQVVDNQEISEQANTDRVTNNEAKQDSKMSKREETDISDDEYKFESKIKLRSESDDERLNKDIHCLAMRYG